MCFAYSEKSKSHQNCTLIVFPVSFNYFASVLFISVTEMIGTLDMYFLWDMDIKCNVPGISSIVMYSHSFVRDIHMCYIEIYII